MHGSISVVRSPPPRRLILGTALLLACAVSALPETTPASAQQAKSAADGATPAVPGKADNAIGKPGVEINITEEPASSTQNNTTKDADSGTQVAPRKRGTVTVTKDGKTVTITGVPHDRDFDSLEEFVEKEPELAGMVVAIVAVVFLAPVLAIALILSYRMRKARMLNETMLKLAEKGIVPPSEALQALAGNNPAAAGSIGAVSPSMAPFYEQAKAVRKRAAWSDLRKGVVMGAIGLGLTMNSLFGGKGSTPSTIGLILLFVGIGYVGLWWFEQRQLTPPGSHGQSSDRGPGGGSPTL